MGISRREQDGENAMSWNSLSGQYIAAARSVCIRYPPDVIETETVLGVDP